jgi:hypothetical protein
MYDQLELAAKLSLAEVAACLIVLVECVQLGQVIFEVDVGEMTHQRILYQKM